MITTTLERIQAHKPSPGYWRKLLAGLGKTEADDEPLPFAKIVEINGLDAALWCCRVEPQYAREWRLFAVWCARQVQHLMTDPRSIAALDVAERYARGEATDEELDAARTDARYAFSSVYIPYDCAAAEWHATVAVWHVAVNAAGDAAAEADAAVRTAAGAVEAAVARAAQIEEFLRLVTETESRT
jgi:hypothetical protein